MQNRTPTSTPLNGDSLVFMTFLRRPITCKNVLQRPPPVFFSLHLYYRNPASPFLWFVEQPRLKPIINCDLEMSANPGSGGWICRNVGGKCEENALKWRARANAQGARLVWGTAVISREGKEKETRDAGEEGKKLVERSDMRKLTRKMW